MADANIGGALPVGDNDGLTAIATDLIADPSRLHVMLAVIDTQKITTKTDDGTKVATVRIRRIERVLAPDLPAAEKLMRRALEHRTGHETLPLELEDELTEAFREFDPSEPEGDGKDEPPK